MLGQERRACSTYIGRPALHPHHCVTLGERGKREPRRPRGSPYLPGKAVSTYSASSAQYIRPASTCKLCLSGKPAS
eukprot:scaffold706_cov418-Prasinococcus_capsulatus_cf.AAC.27